MTDAQLARQAPRLAQKALTPTWTERADATPAVDVALLELALSSSRTSRALAKTSVPSPSARQERTKLICTCTLRSGWKNLRALTQSVRTSSIT